MTVRKKTTNETTTVPVGALIPQPNGRGALRNGGPNKGGPGRPKDVVRLKLAGLAKGKGFRFLNDLMDGKIRVRLIGKCEACGATGAPDPDWIKQFSELLGASVDQRLRGLEQAHRYGVGTKDEIDIEKHPDVKQLVLNLAQATIQVFGVEGYKKLSDRIVELEKAS